MRIKEALIRKDTSDIVYIGEVAQKMYESEAGELLRALLNGYIGEEAIRHKEDEKTSADRVLGRIEMCQTILDDIEFMIDQARKLKEPIIEESDQ